MIAMNIELYDISEMLRNVAIIDKCLTNLSIPVALKCFI